jgi:hypothetical protein
MSIPTHFGIQGLQPAFANELGVKRVASLPWGGPLDGSGKWAQGLALGCPGVAVQSEVVTLTIGGSPAGGTFTVSFTGGGGSYVTSAMAYNVSTAGFLAALIAAVPEWSGNVGVTGTAGSSYVLTFSNNLANQRIGGLFTANVGSLTGGTPTGTWVRTTRGSAGLAQMDAYSQASNNFIDGFLKYDTTLSPGGALVPVGIASAAVAAGQPFQPTVYQEGIFNAADLVGLDANAYTLGKLFKMSGGLYVRLI